MHCEIMTPTKQAINNDPNQTGYNLYVKLHVFEHILSTTFGTQTIYYI